ncbi:MAG: carboxypeptidase regulatory-like domain-containing protein, partial [Chloroflexi bacterium]|nr:carboxypeptidase regulatory-like domain-containing protein [Chloroflexota bacterium]
MRRRSMLLVMLTIMLCLQSVALPAVALAVEEETASTGATLATVSGTIRHNGVPVAGVQVDVWWESGGERRATGADGRYSVPGVPTGGWVAISVVPPVHLRLAYRNWGREPVTGNLVKDFDLQAGRLLSGELRTPQGQRHEVGLWLDTIAHQITLPEGEWLGAGVEGGRFVVVLPPDIYTLDGLPRPYYLPRTAVDLRQADRTNWVITLLARPEPPFPTEPPRADLISVSLPDAEGYATVTGGRGAVLPLS